MTAAKHNTHETAEDKKALSCFVVMPISDTDPYPTGHFRRVYDHLIVPACKRAGFKPTLASEVKETNLIVLDILERLHASDMVLCDLSSRNPNVLYELGFRQAFNKPVTLIKDLITERIFDIAGLRDIPYDHTLRIDTTNGAIAEIAERMRATHEASEKEEGGVNSLVQLMSVEEATVPKRKDVSQDTRLILNALEDLGDRVSAIELRGRTAQRSAGGMARPPVDFQQPLRRTHLDIGIANANATKRQVVFSYLLNLFPELRFEAYAMPAENSEDSEILRVSGTIPDGLTQRDPDHRIQAISLPSGATLRGVAFTVGG
jgi:hypothetical protein